MTFCSKRVVAALCLGLLSAGTAHAERLAVAGVFLFSVEQQWNSRVHGAMVAAAERGAIDYVYTEHVDPAAFGDVMRQHAHAGADLIVGGAHENEATAREAARDYPHVAVLMGSSGEPQAPNFSVFDTAIHEASYVTGVIAGSTTETNRIGIIAGKPIPGINRLINAFMAGVHSANPAVTFEVKFLGSWHAPEWARALAHAMIDNGADILYAERYGVSTAAAERGVLTVGNVMDTAPQYPGTVLASALWHMEPSIDHAIAGIQNGTYQAEHYRRLSNLDAGGSSVVFDATLLEPATITRIAETQQAIIDKSLTVPINATQPATTP